MAETETVTVYCSERRHEAGSWRPSRCARKATGDDGLCGPHRAGKRKRAQHEARWEIERTQQAYAWTWQREHASELCRGSYQCPLCHQHVQYTPGGPTEAAAIRLHQEGHGSDWTAYEDAGKPPAPPAADGSSEAGS